ncbi:hypothetical protein B0H11DRAFT_2083330, partial [Mycena galericulata]
MNFLELTLLLVPPDLTSTFPSGSAPPDTLRVVTITVWIGVLAAKACIRCGSGSKTGSRLVHCTDAHGWEYVH